MIKQFYTLRINGHDQQCLLPFETMQGALLCLICWANDGRLKQNDRAEIIQHIESAQEVNACDILGV